MKTVSVGIAAYNAEQNIARLLKEVLAQREDGFTISEVLIHVDAGTDRTADAARRVGDSRTRVLEAAERQGFGGSVRRLLVESRGDLVVLLNDDVVLEQPGALAALVAAFHGEPSLGLAFGRPVPYPGLGFVERANFSGWAWFDEVRAALPPKSELAVDGKLVALSRSFVETLGTKLVPPGNVDMHLYYSADQRQFGVRTVREATVRYKNPTGVAEHLRWHTRNAAAHSVRKYFPGAPRTLVSYKLIFSALLRQFWKNPLGMLFIVAVSPVIRWRSRAAANTAPIWDTVASTKQLS